MNCGKRDTRLQTSPTAQYINLIGRYSSSGNILELSTSITKYISAKTQLKLNSASQLYPGIDAYSSNGIITGDDTIWDSTPDNIKAEALNLQNTRLVDNVMLYGTYNTTPLYLSEPTSTKVNMKLQYAKESASSIPELWGAIFNGIIHERTRAMYNTNRSVYISSLSGASLTIYDSTTDEVLTTHDITVMGAKDPRGHVVYGYVRNGRTVTIYKVDLDDYETLTTVGSFTFTIDASSTYYPYSVVFYAQPYIDTGINSCWLFTNNNATYVSSGSYYNISVNIWLFDMINERIVQVHNSTNSKGYNYATQVTPTPIVSKNYAIIAFPRVYNGAAWYNIYKYTFSTGAISTIYDSATAPTGFLSPGFNQSGTYIEDNGYLYCLQSKSRLNLSNGTIENVTSTTYVDGVVETLNNNPGYYNYDKFNHCVFMQSISNQYYAYYFDHCTINGTTINWYFVNKGPYGMTFYNANLTPYNIHYTLTQDVIDITNNIATVDGKYEGTFKLIKLERTDNENYDVCYCNFSQYPNTTPTNFQYRPALISSTLDTQNQTILNVSNQNTSVNNGTLIFTE